MIQREGESSRSGLTLEDGEDLAGLFLGGEASVGLCRAEGEALFHDHCERRSG